MSKVTYLAIYERRSVTFQCHIMTDRELNIALREMARSQGLCDKWFDEWTDDSTIDECLDRYVKGFDFSVEKDYPPLEFIRKHFDKELLHKHNIYLDEEVTILADSGYYVFLGKCRAFVTVSGFHVTTIYVRHDSEVDVHTMMNAKAFVTYYDHSHGECDAEHSSNVRKYDKTIHQNQ